ncbi:hypothetical protein ACI8AC_24340 [Geodermatophilus sp. SYSU D00758]
MGHASTTTAPAASRAGRPPAAIGWTAWVAAGLLLLGLAVAGVAWSGGARLLLGAAGLAVGAAGARAGVRSPAGVTAVAGGLAGLAVAALSGPLSAGVLLVTVPAGLLAGALTLLRRGGEARRGGQAALVWCALVTGLLVAAWLGSGWERATGGATVVAALVTGLLGVVLLVGGATRRAVPDRPGPAARPAACAGCACGAGGCLPRA